MARTLDLRTEGGDIAARSRAPVAGLGLGAVGLALVAVAVVGGLVAGGLTDDPGTADRIARAGAWTFGLTTLGFAALKLGIATVLGSILVHAWRRADAVREALHRLLPPREGDPRIVETVVDTEAGLATISATAPRPLTIHRVARALWAPMLVMGAMAVAAGFVISLVWADTVGEGSTTALAAWTQGLQFLGEGMLLGGISFLLGTILYALRTSGGEIQGSLGVAVKTLVMPATAKAFIALMVLGMMAEIAQFVGYLVVAASGADPAAGSAWLGPLRESGLGLLLAGIVLALATIAKALRFQFDRVVELVSTGR